MKRNRFISIVLGVAIIVCVLPFHSANADPLRAEKLRLPPGASILVSMLEICAKEVLGGQQAFNQAVETGRQAERQISAACKEKNNARARQITQYYAKTDVGKAAFHCAAKMKPIVQSPSIQKMLGKHKSTANSIMAGRVPSKICY